MEHCLVRSDTQETITQLFPQPEASAINAEKELIIKANVMGHIQLIN